MPGARNGTEAAYQQMSSQGETTMTVGMLLLIIVILMLLGAIPAWPHSSKWGYGPSGGFGLLLIILIVLLVMGRI
jgi:hypothetical protein